VKYEIRYKPAFAAIFITLDPGERIIAEAGAMASMDAGLTMTTQFSGGLIPALLRAGFGGETLFTNTFINRTDGPLNLVLTQSIIGDMEVIQLDGQQQAALCLQPGAYIASTARIKLGVKWAGFNSWLAGEGLFKLQVESNGKGLVFFGAYGGLTKRQISQDFIVDSGHLVAYEPQIKLNVRFAKGIIGSLTSGEGLVNHLKGTGVIYLQSRSVDGLVRFLRPKLR
jgi:uncharacterized protein (TIGR00266 family)